MKCLVIKVFFHFFLNSNSKTLIGTLSIVEIENIELTFLVMLKFHG